MKLFSSHRGFLTNVMYYQIKLTHDDTKKRAHDSQIVRVKENLKLSYGGPRQRQAFGTSQRIKVLRQGRPTVVQFKRKA